MSTQSAYDMAKHEYKIQKGLKHPNVVECLGYSWMTWDIENVKKVDASVLVLEYIGGGELIDYIMNGGGFGERICRFFFL